MEHTALLGHEQVAAMNSSLPLNVLALLGGATLTAQAGIYTYYRYKSLAIPLLCCQHMQADQMHSSALWLLCRISYRQLVRRPHRAAYHS